MGVCISSSFIEHQQPEPARLPTELMDFQFYFYQNWDDWFCRSCGGVCCVVSLMFWWCVNHILYVYWGRPLCLWWFGSGRGVQVRNKLVRQMVQNRNPAQIIMVFDWSNLRHMFWIRLTRDWFRFEARFELAQLHQIRTAFRITLTPDSKPCLLQIRIVIRVPALGTPSWSEFETRSELLWFQIRSLVWSRFETWFEFRHMASQPGPNSKRVSTCSDLWLAQIGNVFWSLHVVGPDS